MPPTQVDRQRRAGPRSRRRAGGRGRIATPPQYTTVFRPADGRRGPPRPRVFGSRGDELRNRAELLQKRSHPLLRTSASPSSSGAVRVGFRSRAPSPSARSIRVPAARLRPESSTTSACRAQRRVRDGPCRPGRRRRPTHTRRSHSSTCGRCRTSLHGAARRATLPRCCAPRDLDDGPIALRYPAARASGVPVPPPGGPRHRDRAGEIRARALAWRSSATARRAEALEAADLWRARRRGHGRRRALASRST